MFWYVSFIGPSQPIITILSIIFSFNACLPVNHQSFFIFFNYKIVQTTSKNYVPDTTKWKVVYEPATKIKTKNSCIEDDEFDEPSDKLLTGKCLLKIKK